MSLPNIPVNPAIKTARCNWMNAFFMTEAKKTKEEGSRK